MNILGKVAVVTGASTGIGAAIARELSRSGMKLVLTARSVERLDDVLRSLTEEAEVVSGSIGDPKTASQLLDRATARFGQVDVLINNAGMLAMGSVDDIDLDDVSEMIRTNLESVVRCSYVFARKFKAQRHGTILNVSSVAAFGARPTMGVYAGTKAAIETFSNSLRVELGPHGVKVGCIAPGSTSTDMLLELRGHLGMPNDAPAAAPEDIARAVRFMLEQPLGVNIAGVRIYSAGEPN